MATNATDWLALAELKKRLNIVRPERDFELMDWLDAAVQRIENLTGLPLLERTIQVPAQDGCIGYVVAYREVESVSKYESMEAYEDGEAGTAVEPIPEIVELGGHAYESQVANLRANVDGFHVWNIKVGVDPADYPIFIASMTTFCRFLYEGLGELRKGSVFDEALKPYRLWGVSNDAHGFVK